MAKTQKTRANNTWTESRFFSFLRSNLRRASVKWPPIHAAKKDARRAYEGPDKNRKWEYQCAICKGWFKGTDTQVDHIEPAGSLKSFEDLQGFVERLFCEKDGLQVLCKTCHKNEKTDKENESRRKK